jgi:hypothetical protein
MPGLAHYFHLRPQDLGGMQAAEIQEFLDALDEIGRSQKKG